MNKLIGVLFLLWALGTHLSAQQKHIISGTISDASSGETLIGATVYVQEISGLGTITNAYGFYSLTVPEGAYTIVVSFMGYESFAKKINLNENLRIDASLKSNNKQIDEIKVSAEKKNSNITSESAGIEKISPKDTETIPVLLGEQDVVKTLTLTPGVKSSGEGSGGMFVRGGNNSQNLILLDEATVYNSNHMMGFFSTFNSDAIKTLTLYKGTAPVQYGGRTSSVMDIKMKDGNNQNFHVGGGIGLLSSKANIEGPIKKGKGSFLIAGRRTYADLFLKLSSDDDINDNQLYFYDLNLKANYTINPNNRIYLSGYFGRDVISAQDIFGMDWGNITGTLRWNHIWNSKLFSNTTFIYSDYSYKIDIDVDNIDISLLSVINNYNLKQDFNYFINSNTSLNFGVYGNRNNITPGQVEASASSNLHPEDIQNRYSFEYGAYVGCLWKPNTQWIIDGGVRFNVFNSVGEGDFYTYANHEVVDTTYYGKNEIVESYYNLEPRLNISYIFNQNSSVKLSYTRNTQNLHLIQNSTTSSPTDVWIGSSQNVKPEICDQISAGWFKNFKDNQFQFSAETYYKWMQNQIDLKNGADINANELIEGELLYGKGRAYGLELMLKKKYGQLNGWLSYTLSRTEKQIDNINNNNWYAARQDATHDISAVLMYKLNSKWSLSASWVYNTGNAVTFPSGKYMVNGEVQMYYTERNGYRMPDYHRLDLGATCQLRKSEKFESSLNFSLYNAYGRKNAYMIDFEVDPDDDTKTIATKTYLFTFMPSISYVFKF